MIDQMDSIFLYSYHAPSFQSISSSNSKPSHKGIYNNISNRPFFKASQWYHASSSYIPKPMKVLYWFDIIEQSKDKRGVGGTDVWVVMVVRVWKLKFYP